ncbi:GntR family transcriptional regulator [Spirillospora sp. NBC_01491]|uniref:GntR family transcriptional regulator n=1 Tax=Spirillospora sp. NBC_01491 TaxID=2976007 RepID=UPI002E3386F0|nr:GntR family transcriptional regulator [Spirillospora sp. NBC_01491]
MTRPPGPDRPLYTRIAMSLKSRILAGQHRPGERLPSEDELARAMECSRGTVRQALADLRKAGYVTSRRGAGSHVADPLPIESLSPRSGPVYTGFLDDLDHESHHVRELHRTREVVAADEAVAERLRVPVGTRVARYRATRLRHGRPYGIATDVVPLAVAGAITPDALDGGPTLVDALALAGRPVVESLQRIEPATLTAADAAGCGLAPGAPVLAVTGVAYGQDRVPLDAYTLVIVGGHGIGLHLIRAAPGPRTAAHP